jgi:hypothetical protein
LVNVLNKWFTKPGLTGPVIPEIPVDTGKVDIARTEKFPSGGPVPWLDLPNAINEINCRVENKVLTTENADLCKKWVRDGYIILKGVFSREELEAGWKQYESAIAKGHLVPPEKQEDEVLPERVLNPHFKVKSIEDILNHKKMTDMVTMLLGAEALPFQTIMGHRGSQQKAHSDSIHMTTYPQRYLVANWVAFEDIHPDSGPLVYYPGSHRLPYAYSQNVGIDIEEGRKGYEAYHEKYEPFIQDLIEKNGLKPEFFDAKSGDVLFWHANLLHGGSPRRDPQWSRHALVCHYFAEGCVCYHDYTGTLSHLHSKPSIDKITAHSTFLNRQFNRIIRKIRGAPDDFDGEAYLAANPDVAAAGVDPYEHYINHGQAEGRQRFQK